MKKVVITGQSGFMGTHLFNYLKYIRNDFELIPFEDKFFEDQKILNDICSNADFIIHLAALNRHNDPNEIYKINVELVKRIINGCESVNSKPHIIFSSSTQEDKNNVYGKSKKEGRKLFVEWAKKNNSKFTGLIIPNVFGPFGNPFYNSVIATFSYQLTHNEKPKVDIDSNMKLIYVSELVSEIYNIIKNNKINSELKLEHTFEIKVSALLEQLLKYKEQYLERGIFPEIKNNFERNLFNTFRSYIDHSSFFPFKLQQHIDDRGIFVETTKTNIGGQISFSVTKSNITRGNHFHTRKIERFVVIKGKAKIEIRRIGTNNILSFELDGNEPSLVDMPTWYTHNITNIGNEDLLTIFWINEFYDQKDPDTYYELV